MADLRVTEIAISLPFSINAFGSVSSTTSQEKIWADRVRVAVGTGVHERVMRPNYGADIRSAVMGTSEDADTLIRQEIELAFDRDLPLLKLEDVVTSYNEGSGALNVEVTYLLPNRQIETVVLGFAVLSGNDPITEDVV